MLMAQLLSSVVNSLRRWVEDRAAGDRFVVEQMRALVAMPSIRRPPRAGSINLRVIRSRTRKVA